MVSNTKDTKLTEKKAAAPANSPIIHEDCDIVKAYLDAHPLEDFDEKEYDELVMTAKEQELYIDDDGMSDEDYDRVGIGDTAPLCEFCKFFDKKTLAEKGPLKCKAYPNGVPDFIIAGGNHMKPYVGDKGVQFEVRPGDEASFKTWMEGMNALVPGRYSAAPASAAEKPVEEEKEEPAKEEKAALKVVKAKAKAKKQ